MKLKVLAAPLNWGLGHATRLSALIDRRIAAGDEVVIAGDGMSFEWLKRRYPTLRAILLPSLELHYAADGNQVKDLLKQLPQVVRWLWNDGKALDSLLAKEHFDLVISDNRFAFSSRRVKCVYVTHQLNVMTGNHALLSRLATAMHRWFIRHYDECWVPDYEAAPGLAGDLSHIKGGVAKINEQSERFKIKYVGPLSRFGGRIRSQESGGKSQEARDMTYQVHHELSATNVAVLSGLEPHRTMLENELMRRWQGSDYVIIRGMVGGAECHVDSSSHGLGHLLDTADDATLERLLLNAKHIVCRSGYSTIMDLDALGLLPQHDIQGNAHLHNDETLKENETKNTNRLVELIPTPGQPEQEYLAKLHTAQNK
ncbi:MAG: hypothetical protein IJU35_06515 [Paludibacteraceae bacterium]|nr:hypothetical protein [Paludibacteraceae bacterium]